MRDGSMHRSTAAAALAAACALGAVPGTASATTSAAGAGAAGAGGSGAVVQIRNTGPIAGGLSGITLDQFDTLGGTRSLDAIEIELAGTYAAAAEIDAFDTGVLGPLFGTLTISVDLLVELDPFGLTPIAQDSEELVLPPFLGPGSTYPVSVSGETYEDQFAVSAAAGGIINGSLFDAFTGTGTIDLDLVTGANLAVAPFGFDALNEDLRPSSTFDTTVTVTYRFTDVPEIPGPGAAAALGAGLALGAGRRRRDAAA